MVEKRVALLVMSISSLSIWELLTCTNIIGGKMQSMFVLLSLLLFVYYAYNLLRDNEFENSYFKFIFSIFIFYELIIVIRGWSFAFDDLKTNMQTGYILWPFIIPLFIFFDKNVITFGLFFKWIYYSGLFFLGLVLFFPSYLFDRLTAETIIALVIPSGFLLLNATYLSDRRVFISFLIVFISILSLTYLARRSSLVTLVGFVISSYFLHLANKSRSNFFRYFPLIIVIVTLILYSFDNVSERLTRKMTERIYEDTRTELYEMFFFDLKDDILLGKGMNGTYYYPFGEDSEADGIVFGAIEYRNIIENGYLQLFLTGGILHIILFSMILLPSAFKGIFDSSNQFSKACGILILLQLIDMFLYGLPKLSLHYILVWICVGVCYKSSIRRMTDNEIRRELTNIDKL